MPQAHAANRPQADAARRRVWRRAGRGVKLPDHLVCSDGPRQPGSGSVAADGTRSAERARGSAGRRDADRLAVWLRDRPRPGRRAASAATAR
ncbi:hypothetical protein FLP41_01675 (plasmid) [Paracoccus marcusii]|uniref:hypothetical protein n=1 Tax=Paracoccus marcusii TaxID=59779 RepID=UPI002ED0C5D2|nr:hypothetical protein FLP41_01675 [Paracoccus marcusii]